MWYVICKNIKPILYLYVGVSVILMPFSPISQNLFVDENAFSDSVQSYSEQSQADLDAIYEIETQIHQR